MKQWEAKQEEKGYLTWQEYLEAYQEDKENSNDKSNM
jgi:hypothetical protein